MNKSLKVSVSVLAFNHQDYIASCLDSILMQEVDFEFEILIHDDASTDKTVSIIKSYAKRFPKIVKPILQSQNQYSLGRQISLNNFRRAQGEYIAICDGDDQWIDPQKLKKQVNFLDNNKEFIISYTDALMIDQNDRRIETKKSPICKNASVFELGTGFNIHTSSAVFRNVMQSFPTVLEGCPIGDLAFWAYLSKFGQGSFNADCIPINYRVHNESMFSSRTATDKTFDIGVTFLLISKFHYEEGRFDMTKRTMFLSTFYVIKLLRFRFITELLRYILRKVIG